MKPNHFLTLLFIVILIDNMAASIALPVSMNILDGEYDVDKTLFASSVIFLLSPAYIIASPLFGWLSDKIGRKKLLLTCLCISLFGHLVLLIASCTNSLSLGLLSILLGNTGSSSMTIVQAAAADASQGMKRAYVLGLIVAVMLPVFLLVAQFSEELLNFFQHTNTIYNILIVIAILLTAANIFITALKIPESHNSPCFLSHEREDIFCTLARMFHNKLALNLILLLVIVQFACGLFFGSDTQYLTNTLGNAAVKTISTIEYLIMLFSLTLLYPLLTRFFSIQNILIGSILLCFIGALGHEIKSTLSYQWISLMFISAGQCIAIASIWWLLLEVVAPQDWGFSMGIKGSAWSLAWILSILVGNSLAHETVSPASFHITISVLLVSIFYACFLSKKIKMLH